MQRTKYIVLFITGLILFQSVSCYSETEKMNSYVNPEVNVSYLIEGANGLTVEKIVSDHLSTLDFQLSSSVSAGEYGKRWAEKGMVKSLWNNQDKYVDLSNLLNAKCFNLRIYTSSEKESRDIEAQVISKVSQNYPDYIKYDNLQCR